MSKRLFDIVCSVIGLLVLLPVLLAITAWIKIDSRGPALFRQQRIGRYGRPFLIHKFRTMTEGASGSLITVGSDARVTRAGALLRRTKLDELPQLWDVLRGAMSLVGPRPEVPRYVAMYPADLRKVVLSVRPGLTDPASLQFRNESEQLARAADPEREYVEVVMPAKLQAAADYVRSASLASDLQLLLRTFIAIFSH